MPRVLKLGPKRQKFPKPESEGKLHIRFNERTLRLQSMREARSFRLRVQTPKSKGKRLLEQRDRNRIHLNKETHTKKKAWLRAMIEL